jgi:hypothetical protein
MRLRARTFLSALAAVAVLMVGATAAQAKVIELTGSTTFTPSTQATTFLANHGISVTPTGATTTENGAFVFPIAAGFGNPKSLNGLLAHRGGLKLSKGERSAVVRNFVAVRVKRGAVLLAQVPRLNGGCGKLRSALVRFGLNHKAQLRKHPKATRKLLRAVRNYCSNGRVVVLARLTNLAKKDRYNGALLNADLKLSRESARLINRVAHSKVVSAGAPLGSAESAVSTVD